MTISLRKSPEVTRRFANIVKDNLGIAVRPLKPKIEKDVIPAMNRIWNTTRLPTGLDQLEKEFRDKVFRPRSRYKYSVLREGCLKYQYVPDIPYKAESSLDSIPYRHPFKSSLSHELDLTLDRNIRALKKGPGLPFRPPRGKKADAWRGAKQYNTFIVKPSRSTKWCYSIFPGHRTQQSPLDSPKVRLVWQIPCHIWLMECEAYDDGLSRTVSENKGNIQNEIKLFYDTPEGIHKWYTNKSTSVIDWLNADASSFDASVGRSELADIVRYLGGGYRYSDLLADYTATAALVMPEGDIVRNGGMPSGSKLTNWGDSYANTRDGIEVINQLGLSKYLEVILCNGDDISLGFSTKLRNEQLEKWDRYSRRNINAEKSQVGSYVWNSKWYIDNKIMTRPIFRVLNSLMFKEHQFNPITGSKQYVAVTVAQQLADVAEHPLADALYKEIGKIDKYPLSSFTDEELIPYVEAYLDDHSWAADWMGNPKNYIKKLRRTPYADLEAIGI